MELSEFLLARIAEDEAVASPFRNDFGEVKPWRCDEIGGKVRQVGPTEFGLPDVIAEADTHLTAEHIARHDPVHVLAECEAKRHLIRLAQRPSLGAQGFKAGVEMAFNAALRLLAFPYADHPDYDSSWRP